MPEGLVSQIGRSGEEEKVVFVGGFDGDGGDLKGMEMMVINCKEKGRRGSMRWWEWCCWCRRWVVVMIERVVKW